MNRKNSLLTRAQIQSLRSSFGKDLVQDGPVSKYTTMRVGGEADFLLKVTTLADLEKAVRLCWTEEIPFILLGAGSNVLVSDAGIRELVILNRAKKVEFRDRRGEKPLIWAESGAGLGSVSRRAANRGWSGLEWAEGIPGTVGGAAVNNAGAFGSDMAEDLHMAEILHHDNQEIRRVQWSAEDFAYDYRTSLIKRKEVDAVVLAVEFILERSTSDEVKKTMGEITKQRRSKQPPGSSIGSMFKNPQDDYAGRLIERAGLKGTRRGDVEISPQHANFFINHGDASAVEVQALIKLVQQIVEEKFNVRLDLEIEFIGEW
ncbi:MAG: UDP-N-acetylmuramate dehydrogenase [Anaerolineales bacterium]